MMTRKSLYTPQLERDACGIGFVAHIKGKKSHQIVEDGLVMLANMEHRGGEGYDTLSGDGAGILVQTPHAFLQGECARLGFELPAYGQYGVGAMFFNTDPEVVQATKARIRLHLEQLGFELLGYRKVPVDNRGIGRQARESELPLEQIFVCLKDRNATPEQLERKLFVLRKLTTHSVGRSATGVPGNDYEFYWLSLSYKTLVYKGMLQAGQIRDYFPDLQHPSFASALALVHSRFSTNTVPKWKLAQPFRYIAHNGEINTIRGNVNRMISKQQLFESKLFSPEEFKLLLPICDKTHSDSANLDSIIEMLTLAGRSLPHAIMMVIPEAWEDNKEMPPDSKAFYEYHAALMEPWDGPASVSFTDGQIVGATLDRNGLRPSRYLVTKDDRVVMASEAGVLPIEEKIIIKKGRLQPGKMFVVDMQRGEIVSGDQIKKELAAQHPYRKWLKKEKISLNALISSGKIPGTRHKENIGGHALETRQLAFGYTREDLKTIIVPMVNEAKEPIGSMGADIPLAPLSKQYQHLANFFKQQFAQVSNPPIDPIREKMVMSLSSALGKNPNILAATPEHCRQIHLEQPVLTPAGLNTLKQIDRPGLKARVIYTTYSKGRPFEEVLTEISMQAETAVLTGHTLIILSDENISEKLIPLPSLLALGLVHHHLIRQSLRASASLVVAAGDVRESHHFATLIGYGANAICPYLVFASIDQLYKQGMFLNALTRKQAYQNYLQAIGQGLLKVFSKMGISTLQSYHGAQIFEIIGLNRQVVDKCFAKSVSRIEGWGFKEIFAQQEAQHQKAFAPATSRFRVLAEGGLYQWKQQGEAHLFTPETIRLLQQATRNNNYALYQEFARKVNRQAPNPITLRSLLHFRQQQPIPLEEVEPAENILSRFSTGAMSFGSLSYEAHSAIAVAMNRLGAKSNSGEGGEDEARYTPKPNGDSERSAIKQIASGRFGVTSYYLAQADEIQIKMAQGAKPGEGGQLPGHKVDEWIARVRHSTPGVGLISPPPHHDIYSIEDLAQLIYDLKLANRQARINVKLVSEAGVGTIASGVAKAKADAVLISGHDGGTGASPLGSVRHAGLPWELGVAEVHQTLLRNKLRNRITVQADGQMRTGKDLAVATLLGAEEWSIATAVLVTLGCVMMRKCHLNTCPVGIATQNKGLRQRFSGNPDYLVNYFMFLARDLREIMAELGFKTVNEMVGRVDKLVLSERTSQPEFACLDFSAILYKPEVSAEDGPYKQREQQTKLAQALDWQLLKQASPALKSGKKVSATFKINNTNRSVGTLLANEISKKYRSNGLPEDTIRFSFTGPAGQSFAAFATKGLTLTIEGEANDYVGKGLSGAKVAVYPPSEAPFVAAENQIIGNVALYGATAGKLFVCGLAGERFAVRNSGARAVVEGVGDHGCEYMTGGEVVILGKIGRNFAAGMSGGEAFIYGNTPQQLARVNTETADIEPLSQDSCSRVKALIEEHVAATRSAKGKQLLANWPREAQRFFKIMPRDYKAALKAAGNPLKKQPLSQT